MLKNTDDPKNLQQLLLWLLSTSGTLAGLSMTVVGIVNLKVSNSQVETLANVLFLASLTSLVAAGFVVVYAFN